MNKYYDLDSSRNDSYFVRIDPRDPEKLDMSFNLKIQKQKCFLLRTENMWEKN